MAENKQHEETLDEEVVLEEQDEVVETANKNETEVEEIETETELSLEEKLEEEITVLKEQLKEVEDKALREKAEIENFKRRLKQESETNLKFSNQVLIENMLPVLDSFNRALEGADKDDEAVMQFLKGFEMIQMLLMQVLEGEGLEKIDTVGKEFDPYIHQAVSKENNDDVEDNIILEELQTGYKLKDRVIRASMVKVNTKE